MPIQPVRHLTVGVARPHDQVYAFLADPENFPTWAQGLGHSFQHVSGMEWLVETPSGRTRVLFSEPNSFGVVDHVVMPEHAEPIPNPMRVIANADGGEVVFTLFRRPGVSDEEFERDSAAVSHDLMRLKTLLEA